MADDRAGRRLDAAGHGDRGLPRHAQCLEPRRRLRPVLDRLDADALLDAGVVARPPAHRRTVGRLRPGARDLPDRRPQLRRRRSGQPQRAPRHRVAPDPAGNHAHPRLSRGVLPHHAVVAPRRARRGLSGDGTRQGPARHRGTPPACGAERAPADHHAGGAEHRLRGLGCHHDRDDLLDPGAGAAVLRGARGARLRRPAGHLLARVCGGDLRQPCREPPLRPARPRVRT